MTNLISRIHSPVRVLYAWLYNLHIWEQTHICTKKRPCIYLSIKILISHLPSPVLMSYIWFYNLYIWKQTYICTKKRPNMYIYHVCIYNDSDLTFIFPCTCLIYKTLQSIYMKTDLYMYKKETKYVHIPRIYL